MRLFRKCRKFIFPIGLNLILAIIIYLFFQKFPPKGDSIFGIILIGCGIATIIVTLTISISSMQIVVFFLYVTYRIRKLFNKKLSMYNDPYTYRECHEFLSSEEFISTWFSYLLGTILFVSGLIIRSSYINNIIPQM